MIIKFIWYTIQFEKTCSPIPLSEVPRLSLRHVPPNRHPGRVCWSVEYLELATIWWKDIEGDSRNQTGIECHWIKSAYHTPYCDQKQFAWLKCSSCQHVRPRLVMNIKRNPFNCAHLFLLISSLVKKPAALRCHQTLRAAKASPTRPYKWRP